MITGTTRVPGERMQVWGPTERSGRPHGEGPGTARAGVGMDADSIGAVDCHSSVFSHAAVQISLRIETPAIAAVVRDFAAAPPGAATFVPTATQAMIWPNARRPQARS